MEETSSRNLYTAIADACGLSERTVRKAFKREAVPLQTARKISRVLGGVDLIHFRIKPDNRGRNKRPRTPKEQ